MSYSHNLPIVLIGPIASGKSTIGKELEKLTGIVNVPMDRVRWYYYFKEGYSLKTQSEFENFDQVAEYWKPFELDALKKIIQDFDQSIIDFGAGHSHYSDPVQLQEAKEALSSIKNVFLLTPSGDRQESFDICLQRLKDNGHPCSGDDDVIKHNERFIFEESNYILAKKTVYSKNKTAEDVAKEILENLD